MFKYIADVYKYKFVRQTAILQVGSFGGNILQALVVIFLARLLKPDLFGVYTLAFSLAAWVISFINIGAQDAVTTVMSESYALNNKDRIHEALAFFIKMAVIVGALGFAVSFFVPFLAERIYNNKAIGLYAAVIIIASLFSTTFYTLLYMTLQVVGRIRSMAILAFSDQALRNLLALCLVFLGFGVLGATVGHLLGALVLFFVTIFLWKNIRAKYGIFPDLPQLIKKARIANLKKYFKFSALIAIDRNLGNLYSILPVVIIGTTVSTAEVSFFKLSFAYVNLALSLLGPISILLNVEFPKIKVLSSGELRQTFIKISFIGMALATILTTGAIITAPWLFKFFYGQEYLPSIKYVVGFIIYGIVFGLGITFGPMWRAINKVKVSILVNLITLGLGIPLGIWLIGSYGIWGGIGMVTTWFSISHLISFIYLSKNLKHINL